MWGDDGSIALSHSDRKASENFVRFTMDNLITMIQRANKRKPKKVPKSQKGVRKR